MSSPRHRVIELYEQGALPADKLAQGFAAAEVTPDGDAWRDFADTLLLWLGGLCLAFAAMFFIAYNWADLGRFGKFGLTELLLVAAVVAYLRFSEHAVAGKVALLVATILLGVLLALYGQTYQTGADPWQLFFNWALLCLPWVLIARFPALWIGWILLLELSAVLYHDTFGGVLGWPLPRDDGTSLLLFVMSTLALIAWELSSRIWRWLREPWAKRFLAASAGAPLTWLIWDGLFDDSEALGAYLVIWVVWFAALFWFYHQVRPDLFMLAGGCLSVIVILISLMIKYLFDELSAGVMLFLALTVIGLGTGSAIWLRKVQEALRS